jgi:MFS family permease
VSRLAIYFFMTHLAGGIVMTTAIASLLIAREDTDSYVWMGSLCAVGAISYAAASFTLGGMSDRFGRRPVAAAGMGLTAFASLIAAARPTLSCLILFFLLMNIGMSLFFTSVEGLLADTPARGWNIARKVSLYNISWCSGDILGSVAGAWLVGQERRLPFYVAAAAAAACAALIIRDGLRMKRHEVSENGLADKAGQDGAVSGAARPGLAAEFAKAGRIGLFFGAAAMGLAVANFTKYAVDRGASPEAAGTIIAAMFAVEVAAFFALGRIQMWRWNAGLQLLMNAVMPAGCAAVALGESLFVITVGMLAIGIGHACIYTFSISYSLSLGHGDRARQGGIHEAAIGMGNAMGPAITGGLAYFSSDDRLLFLPWAWC